MPGEKAASPNLGLENPALSSARIVHKTSRHVQIDNSRIEEAATKILAGIKAESYSAGTWKQHPLNPKVANEEAIEWVFVVDLLNFCFWTKPSDKHREYAVTYKGMRYTGYWSLCACINRALEEGIPITTADFYRTVTVSQLEHIFRADSHNMEQIKMLEERHQVLVEAGNVLVSKFGGKFMNVLGSIDHSARRLVSTVIQNFPSFYDSVLVDKQEIFFLKRAQILVADIWACFENTSYGHFSDIEYLTMFADYRVPQVLLFLGVLKYSQELTERLQRSYFSEGPVSGSDLITRGDRCEIEIRGNSIYVVELLRQAILEQTEHKIEINSVLLDFYLWDYAKEHAAEMRDIPIHLTKSIYY